MWIKAKKPSKREISCARLEQNTTPNPPNARKVAQVWSATQPQTLQTRDKLRTFGAQHNRKPSKRETNSPRLERQTSHNPPNARQIPLVWSAKPATTLQTRDIFPTFGAKHHTKPSKREISCARLERSTGNNHPNAREITCKCGQSNNQATSFCARSRVW